MKSGTLVFASAFAALAASWAGFVLAPQIQIGRSGQAAAVGSGDLYPQARAGLANQGALVYRANGCVYCHSQQAGQQGAHCEVVLTDAGTNAARTLAALAKVNPDFEKAAELPALPKAVAIVADMNAADAAIKKLRAGGGKAEAHTVPFGVDIARGWGQRRSVAQDYLFDEVALPGTRRIGPDLANIAARQPDKNWHLRHLYSPGTVVEGSTMPPYRFLFSVRKLADGEKLSADGIYLTADGKFFQDGKTGAAVTELVPGDDARSLAAYLASLRSDAPLFEAPMTSAK